MLCVHVGVGRERMCHLECTPCWRGEGKIFGAVSQDPDENLSMPTPDIHQGFVLVFRGERKAALRESARHSIRFQSILGIVFLKFFRIFVLLADQAEKDLGDELTTRRKDSVKFTIFWKISSEM